MRAIFLDFIRKGGPYFTIHGMYKVYSQMNDRMYYQIIMKDSCNGKKGVFKGKSRRFNRPSG